MKKIESIMRTVLIEDNTPQAKQFVKYDHTLPSATIVSEPVMSFVQATKECNAVSVDEFFDELDERIKRRFNA